MILRYYSADQISPHNPIQSYKAKTSDLEKLEERHQKAVEALTQTDATRWDSLKKEVAAVLV